MEVDDARVCQRPATILQQEDDHLQARREKYRWQQADPSIVEQQQAAKGEKYRRQHGDPAMLKGTKEELRRAAQRLRRELRAQSARESAMAREVYAREHQAELAMAREVHARQRRAEQRAKLRERQLDAGLREMHRERARLKKKQWRKDSGVRDREEIARRRRYELRNTAERAAEQATRARARRAARAAFMHTVFKELRMTLGVVRLDRELINRVLSEAD